MCSMSHSNAVRNRSQSVTRIRTVRKYKFCASAVNTDTGLPFVENCIAGHRRGRVTQSSVIQSEPRGQDAFRENRTMVSEAAGRSLQMREWSNDDLLTTLGPWQRIYVALRSMILSGELEPGARLVEVELAERF